MTSIKDFFFWTFRFDVMTIAVENEHELEQTFPRDEKHSVSLYVGDFFLLHRTWLITCP